MTLQVHKSCPCFLEVKSPLGASDSKLFVNALQMTTLLETPNGIYANVGKDKYQLNDSDANYTIISNMLNIKA